MPVLVGLFYRNASGLVQNAAVINFRLGAGLEGCQSGQGIFVQSLAPGTSVVTIEGTSVNGYQKNGIVGNEVGTDIRVGKGNVVRGLGPTTGAAQNGIQIAFGAKGRIEMNIITNNIWSPCTPLVCAAAATDILVFEAASGVTITGNTVGLSNVGVYVLASNAAAVVGNAIFGIDPFDGVALVANSGQVKDNAITGITEAGVFLEGNNNEVKSNRFNDMPVGVLKSGGTGNVVAGNTFFNTPTPDPDGPPPPSPSPWR